MLPPDAGRDESTYIGYAVVSALLDLLIERNILTSSEVRGMILDVADRLSKDNQFMHKGAADVLRKGVPK